MTQPIVMPSFGMYTSDGKLASWQVADGTRVDVGQVIATIETEKSTYEIPAPVAGILQHVESVGAALREEQVLGYVNPIGGEPATIGNGQLAITEANSLLIANGTSPWDSQLPHASNGNSDWVKASPIARRIAKENSLDLASIKGSGPGGRIVEADVRAAVAAVRFERSDSSPTAAETVALAGAVNATGDPRIRTRSPLSRMRRTIGERLRRSVNTTVSLTLTREVEADVFVVARKTLGARLGASVPFDALFVKLIAAALRDHPELNATIDGDDLVQFEDVNVAVAVAVSNGLLTPVIQRADAKPLAAVAATIRDWAARAKDNAIRPDELVGGTTTITNLGNFGVDAFTPILNPPQSSILGIGRIRQRPVARDGGLFVANTCVLSLTFDHRVADGVPAAQMLDAVARRMNDDRYLNDLV